MANGTISIKWHDLLQTVINSKAAGKVLLYGPPDTGKTTSAVNAAKAAGRPLYRLQCSCQQGIEDLLGTMELKAGETRFVPGPVPNALKSGGVLCLDEFDMRNPAQDSIYHSILDNSELASVTLPDGVVVPAAQGFTVIATMNGSPADLTPALLRRFDVCIYAGTPHPDALAELPEQVRLTLVQWAQAQPVPEFTGPRSVSAFRSAQRLVKLAGLSTEQAAEVVFGKAMAKEIVSVLASNM